MTFFFRGPPVFLQAPGGLKNEIEKKKGKRDRKMGCKTPTALPRLSYRTRQLFFWLSRPGHDDKVTIKSDVTVTIFFCLRRFRFDKRPNRQTCCFVIQTPQDPRTKAPGVDRECATSLGECTLTHSSHTLSHSSHTLSHTLTHSRRH